MTMAVLTGHYILTTWFADHVRWQAPFLRICSQLCKLLYKQTAGWGIRYPSGGHIHHLGSRPRSAAFLRVHTTRLSIIGAYDRSSYFTCSPSCAPTPACPVPVRCEEGSESGRMARPVKPPRARRHYYK